jgi:tRNA 2-thiouridine synthesizing protein A
MELDCRGLPCPRPIIELAKHIGDVEPGEVLAVTSDDPAARYDVPAWCRMRGHEYAGEDTAEDGVPRYLVRRVS